MYNRYNVNSGDAFQRELYPNVINELEEIGRNTSRMSSDFKNEIIISFLKDHSLQVDWIAKNPKVAKFMTSRSVCTSHLESLFQSCRGNDSFLSGFEEFVKKKLQ
jgi:hypothetical protein